jgi:hypothetical protein
MYEAIAFGWNEHPGDTLGSIVVGGSWSVTVSDSTWAGGAMILTPHFKQ